ncbi:IQ-DOMAIN 14-like protein [Tanacetum coccineum]
MSKHCSPPVPVLWSMDPWAIPRDVKAKFVIQAAIHHVGPEADEIVLSMVFSMLFCQRSSQCPSPLCESRDKGDVSASRLHCRLTARRALRVLRGLVKFQALVKGFIVRKRAAATLYHFKVTSENHRPKYPLKASRVLKGLVKFQALVRGFLVRKRVAATLYSMQALLRAQLAV